MLVLCECFVPSLLAQRRNRRNGTQEGKASAPAAADSPPLATLPLSTARFDDSPPELTASQRDCLCHASWLEVPCFSRWVAPSRERFGQVPFLRLHLIRCFWHPWEIGLPVGARFVRKIWASAISSLASGSLLSASLRAWVTYWVTFCAKI